MANKFPTFIAYFCVMFVVTFLFTAWQVLIWWAARFGYWWAVGAVAFGVAVIAGVMLTVKDPAKVRR